MRKGYLIHLLLFLFLYAQAQNTMQIEEGKAFNFGATVGMNAIFPVINSFTVNGVDVENVRQHYEVGYLASVFCRINIDRYFLQPSFSWYKSESEMTLLFPQSIPTADNFTENTASMADLRIKSYSLQVPIMVGVHIIKQAPYSLSFMVGPSFKYHYNTTYSATYLNTTRDFSNDDKPLELGIAAGIGVSLWQLFFDFSYEFGINQVQSDFKEKQVQTPEIANNLRIDKRTNMMSFSLGFLF